MSTTRDSRTARALLTYLRPMHRLSRPRLLVRKPRSNGLSDGQCDGLGNHPNRCRNALAASMVAGATSAAGILAGGGDHRAKVNHRAQQTRSSIRNVRDSLPVIVQTAPTLRYRMAQLFASAYEGLRFLRLARPFLPKVSRRMPLLRPLFGMF
jgi:hypothetical protein